MNTSESIKAVAKEIPQKLTELADSPETDAKLRTDIYKFLLEMAVGKPRQGAEGAENSAPRVVVSFKTGTEELAE